MAGSPELRFVRNWVGSWTHPEEEFCCRGLGPRETVAGARARSQTSPTEETRRGSLCRGLGPRETVAGARARSQTSPTEESSRGRTSWERRDAAAPRREQRVKAGPVRSGRSSRITNCCHLSAGRDHGGGPRSTNLHRDRASEAQAVTVPPWSAPQTKRLPDAGMRRMGTKTRIRCPS